MQRNITSKVKKSYVQVRSNFRKVTKLRYFCVQLLSSIVHLQDFLSYEIQKYNEKIYSTQHSLSTHTTYLLLFSNDSNVGVGTGAL